MFTRTAGGTGRLPLATSMAVAIAVVTVLASWDASRESAAALNDFAGEQATLARSVAAVVSSRLADLHNDAPEPSVKDLFAGVGGIESASNRRLLLIRGGVPGLSTIGGRIVRDARVEAAAAQGLDSLRLARTDAPNFALPERTAIVGLSAFDGPGGRWTVVVAATASHERDRELRAERRLLFSVLVATGLVLAFGGVALRKQRKELELESRLAIAELARQRDAQLVQIDKLGTLTALASGIAHEVSTPLGVILGRAEQLLPKMVDERAKKHVETIVEQGTRIGHVVRGFLNLVRGDAPSLDRVHPGAIARAAIALVEHRFSKAKVNLRVVVEESTPAISCETPLLEQALINLLLNACDACVSGGTVVLAVRAAEGRVSFVVTDDGSGITEEAAARALEPFFTTKPPGKGTGLGLAIANEIAKSHGGTLVIGPKSEGDASSGTRASIELPIATGP